jgi:hypothetical protein
MTNASSEMGQMAVCCQNPKLGVLSSRSMLSVLVGTLFKKFSLFLNMPHTPSRRHQMTRVLQVTPDTSVHNVVLYDILLVPGIWSGS